MNFISPHHPRQRHNERGRMRFMFSSSYRRIYLYMTVLLAENRQIWEITKIKPYIICSMYVPIIEHRITADVFDAYVEKKKKGEMQLTHSL